MLLQLVIGFALAVIMHVPALDSVEMGRKDTGGSHLSQGEIFAIQIGAIGAIIAIAIAFTLAIKPSEGGSVSDDLQRSNNEKWLSIPAYLLGAFSTALTLSILVSPTFETPVRIPPSDFGFALIASVFLSLIAVVLAAIVNAVESDRLQEERRSEREPLVAERLRLIEAVACGPVVSTRTQGDATRLQTRLLHLLASHQPSYMIAFIRLWGPFIALVAVVCGYLIYFLGDWQNFQKAAIIGGLVIVSNLYLIGKKIDDSRALLTNVYNSVEEIEMKFRRSLPKTIRAVAAVGLIFGLLLGLAVVAKASYGSAAWKGVAAGVGLAIMGPLIALALTIPALLWVRAFGDLAFLDHFQSANRIWAHYERSIGSTKYSGDPLVEGETGSPRVVGRRFWQRAIKNLATVGESSR